MTGTVLAVGWVSWRGKVQHAFVAIGSRSHPDYGTEMVRRADVAVSLYETLCGITDDTTGQTAVVDWGTTELDPELDCKKCLKKMEGN